MALKDLEIRTLKVRDKIYKCSDERGLYAWGRLYCAHHDRDGCMVSVWSTPRNAGNHAQSVIRNVSRCPHQETEEV